MATCVVQHPLLDVNLTTLRSVYSDRGKFRRALNKISQILTLQATMELETSIFSVSTPRSNGDSVGHHMDYDRVVAVPILRAGLGMLEGFLHWLPNARVGYVGISRSESELLTTYEFYLSNLPNVTGAHVYVLDPMLATGGSANEAIEDIKNSPGSPLSVNLLSVVAAPEGIEAVNAEHPDVEIWVAVVDRGLDDQLFIVPGLGDAGDRLNGT